MTALPRVLEPDALRQALGRVELQVVDLSQGYAEGHIPGAVHLDYGHVIAPRPPATGLLPDLPQLQSLCEELGLRPGTQVVVCDDEGGGRAARLLWTLEVMGHQGGALLDGGLPAWCAEGYPLATEPAVGSPSPCRLHINDTLIADKDYLLSHLHDRDTVIIDCRTAAEYRGERVNAQRGGHIPGAINIDWSRSQDPKRQLRLHPAAALRALYEEAGVTPDKEVITYCHSHRRSAHTWLVLTYLGYPRVRCYPGSWSEWGNDPALPIETE